MAAPSPANPRDKEREFFSELSLYLCHGAPTGTGRSGGEQYRSRSTIVKEILHCGSSARWPKTSSANSCRVSFTCGQTGALLPRNPRHQRQLHEPTFLRIMAIRPLPPNPRIGKYPFSLPIRQRLSSRRTGWRHQDSRPDHSLGKLNPLLRPFRCPESILLTVLLRWDKVCVPVE
jgi:hypothetical protein